MIPLFGAIAAANGIKMVDFGEWDIRLGLLEVLMDLSLCGCNLKSNLRMTILRPNLLTSIGQSLISWPAEERVLKSPVSKTKPWSNASVEDGGELPAILGEECHVLAGSPGFGEELIPPCSSWAPCRASSHFQSFPFALLFVADCLYKTEAYGWHLLITLSHQIDFCHRPV